MYAWCCAPLFISRTFFLPYSTGYWSQRALSHNPVLFIVYWDRFSIYCPGCPFGSVSQVPGILSMCTIPGFQFFHDSKLEPTYMLFKQLNSILSSFNIFAYLSYFILVESYSICLLHLLEKRWKTSTMINKNLKFIINEEKLIILYGVTLAIQSILIWLNWPRLAHIKENKVFFNLTNHF